MNLRKEKRVPTPEKKFFAILQNKLKEWREDMINLELTSEQANALGYALFLHTKDDSYDFPSARVVLIREVIDMLDKEIERDFEGKNK